MIQLINRPQDSEIPEWYWDTETSDFGIFIISANS